MSINKYKPHLFIIPEDDANRDLANGFVQHPDVYDRRIQVLAPMGGWHAVLDYFERALVRGMEEYPDRYILLLIDFDGDHNRRSIANQRIPDCLKSRVFILGVWTEPEKLIDLGSREQIGQQLATNCVEQKRNTWNDPLLVHNSPELDRMTLSIRPFLIRS